MRLVDAEEVEKKGCAALEGLDCVAHSPAVSEDAGSKGRFGAARFAARAQGAVSRDLPRDAGRGHRVRPQRRRPPGRQQYRVRPRFSPPGDRPPRRVDRRGRDRAAPDGRRRPGTEPCVSVRRRRNWPTVRTQGRHYGKAVIEERHRHRYEFNNRYLDPLRSAGLVVSGTTEGAGAGGDGELPDHPWYVGCQFHPEFTSTPRDGQSPVRGVREGCDPLPRRAREGRGAPGHAGGEPAGGRRAKGRGRRGPSGRAGALTAMPSHPSHLDALVVEQPRQPGALTAMPSHGLPARAHEAVRFPLRFGSGRRSLGSLRRSAGPHVSPTGRCGRRSPCFALHRGGGPYSRKPLRCGGGYALRVLRSARPARRGVSAPSRLGRAGHASRSGRRRGSAADGALRLPRGSRSAPVPHRRTVRDRIGAAGPRDGGDLAGGGRPGGGRLHLQVLLRQGEPHVRDELSPAPASRKGSGFSSGSARRSACRCSPTCTKTPPIDEAADVADVLQTPAFLCRQTNFIHRVAAAGRPVNIKKGQFPSLLGHGPRGRQGPVGGQRNGSSYAERGASFGYNYLVSGHALARGDARDGLPGGVRRPPIRCRCRGEEAGPRGASANSCRLLARAAVGAGVSGVFMETHPNPAEALSDGPNACRFGSMEPLLETLVAIDPRGEAAPPSWLGGFGRRPRGRRVPGCGVRDAPPGAPPARGPRCGLPGAGGEEGRRWGTDAPVRLCRGNRSYREGACARDHRLTRKTPRWRSEIRLAGGAHGSAAVPSGASTGRTRERSKLRDGGPGALRRQGGAGRGGQRRTRDRPRPARRGRG